MYVGKPGSGQPLQRHSDQPRGVEDSEELFGQRILEADSSRALHTLFLVGLLAHQTCRGHGDPHRWDSLCSCSARKGGSLSLWGVQGGSALRAPHIMSSFRSALLRKGRRTGTCVLAVWKGVQGSGRRVGVMGAGRAWAWSDEDVLGRVALWKAGLCLSTFAAVLPGPLRALVS